MLTALILLTSSTAHAFEYLEHSYFADRACVEAQARLSKRLSSGPRDEALVSRYLALAIVCPSRWDVPYCAGGWKQVEANVNRLPKKASDGGGVAITFGDFAALPDHISRFGPVRHLPKAGRDGLVARVFEWLADEPDGAGGIIGDVSEDACETELVPWARVENDIRSELGRLDQEKSLTNVPGSALSPLARAPVRRGPYDPAGLYSFDNPHFLDKVLRDTDHFGESAYSTWVGFHSTAKDIAVRTCPDVVGFDADYFEGLAEKLPEFEKVDWSSLEAGDPGELRRRGCAVLAERVRRRLLEWGQRGAPVLTQPVQGILASFGAPAAGVRDPAVLALLDRTVAGVIGLVLEGGGLHYLHDNFAGGHLRAVHGRRGLSERRYDHDLDSREGVSALLRTADGEHAFVAFGDSYLLGPPNLENPDCNWKSPTPLAPETLSDCLIRNQRGLLVASATGSLVDWALSGSGDPGTPERRFVAATVPIQMISGAKLQGELPVPPPPFHYESVATHFSTDAAGKGNQLGVDTALYSELGSMAGWLTSHRLGIRATTGEGERNRFALDYAYGFHWRWAARFLIDAEPFVTLGFRDVSPVRDFILGVGPRMAVTFLPEGWVKIPLEFSLAYRMPMTLISSRKGFIGNSFEIEAHWIQLSVGLAFM